MTGGYSTPFAAYILANWRELTETGRLPKRSWTLGVRAGRRIHGGAVHEYPTAIKADMQTALDRLDEETRRIVHLRYLSGLPRYKVARRLGVQNCRALEPIVESAVERLTDILNGGSDMASNGNGNGHQTVEEVRGQELETLYDRLDHKLRDLPPGWRQLQVRREPGTKMFAVAVTY